MRDKTADPAEARAPEAKLKAGKDAKLAAALRTNLMRRKAAARQAASPPNAIQKKD